MKHNNDMPNKETKPSIRIIVGGPPNSGKSTFAESMNRALQNQNIDAEAIDLDIFSPTLDYVKGNITKEEREQQKRKNVTKEDIEDIVKRFTECGTEHQVIIGDAPGGISEESKPIFKAATHGIIICREDEIQQLDSWITFFNEIHIPLVAVVISKIDGEESVESSDLIRVVLVKLDKNNIRITETMMVMATLLRDKIGI